MCSARRVSAGEETSAGYILAIVPLALFVGIVAITGGASRYDALQILPLRSLSAVALIPALYLLSMRMLRPYRVVVSLLLLYSGLVVVQLLPVPAEMSSALPGREVIAELDTLVLDQVPWRPTSMAPARTWNVLGSVIVPAAALFLAIACTSTSVALLRLIAVLGVLNAILAITQLASGRSSIFYFYEVTNLGRAVGIFANENHSGIFAACSVLILAHLSLKARDACEPAWLRIAYPSSLFFVFFVSLVGASRAGFVASFVAMLISAAMVAVAVFEKVKLKPNRGDLREVSKRVALLIFPPMAFVGAIMFSFLALGRAPAFADLVAKDGFEDLRWSLWPILSEMWGVYSLTGAGVGSFEQAYHAFEPPHLLMPVYVNQAHNDWAQLVIEGGWGAAALLFFLLVWVLKAMISIYGAKMVRAAIFWTSVFVLIATASIIDYPLRTPIFQTVLVFFLVALSRDSRLASGASAGPRSGLNHPPGTTPAPGRL